MGLDLGMELERKAGRGVWREISFGPFPTRAIWSFHDRCPDEGFRASAGLTLALTISDRGCVCLAGKVVGVPGLARFALLSLQAPPLCDRERRHRSAGDS